MALSLYVTVHFELNIRSSCCLYIGLFSSLFSDWWQKVTSLTQVAVAAATHAEIVVATIGRYCRQQDMSFDDAYCNTHQICIKTAINIPPKISLSYTHDVTLRFWVTEHRCRILWESIILHETWCWSSLHQPSARHQFTLQDRGYGANASHCVLVFAPAFADTHCSYPRRDGQAELNCCWLLF